MRYNHQYLLVLFLLLVSCSTVPPIESMNTSTPPTLLVSTPITSVITPSPTPMITLEPMSEFRLQWFPPMLLSYSAHSWTIGQEWKNSPVGLVLNNVPGCFLYELGVNDINLKNGKSIKLGDLRYARFILDGNYKQYEHIYSLSNNSPILASNYWAEFSLHIPYEAAESCITEAEKVLATLHAP